MSESSPLGLILHPGLPKSGSTSIQNAFHTGARNFLDKYGIYFGPHSSSFDNDYALYSFALHGLWDKVEAYLDTKIAGARASGATTVLISSEDLYCIPQSPENFQRLLAMVNTKFERRVHIIMVVRDMRNFLRSYIMQLMANGALTMHDDRLADWVISMCEAYWSLPGARISMISFDKAAADQDLVNTFLRTICAEADHVDERHDNVTIRTRSLVYNSFFGSAMRIKAAGLRTHVNAPELQTARRTLHSAYDDFFSNAAPEQKAAVQQFLRPLEAGIGEIIENYLDNCISAVQPERKAMFAKLLANKVTVLAEGDHPFPVTRAAEGNTAVAQSR